MPVDNPTKHITYRIVPPTLLEGIEVRWTDDKADARAAYDNGFFVHQYEIVKVGVSTGQEITTGLATEWRDQ